MYFTSALNLVPWFRWNPLYIKISWEHFTLPQIRCAHNTPSLPFYESKLLSEYVSFQQQFYIIIFNTLLILYLLSNIFFWTYIRLLIFWKDNHITSKYLYTTSYCYICWNIFHVFLTKNICFIYCLVIVFTYISKKIKVLT